MYRSLKEAVDLGFFVVVTLFGVLFGFGTLGWVKISPPPPALILLFVIWCLLYWAKYAFLRRESRKYFSWTLLLCAAITTAMTVFIAILYLGSSME